MCFYRPKQTNCFLCWCPLIFDETYGEPVLAPETIVGDILHTGDGGVAQYSSGANFRIVLDNAVTVLNVQGRTKITRDKLATWKINDFV